VSFFPNSKVKGRKGYQPNLVSLMSLCANNYFLLLKVQADQTDLGEQRHFFINDFLAYQVTVNEVTRYTSLITFEQKIFDLEVSEHDVSPKVFHPRMVIRLYHDARMAEVISSQDVRQVKPRYDYPNVQMHQQDEKQQINQFLNEWLHLCLHMGQVNVPIPTNHE
jgi:uncharacterized protein YqiB (DUF1249 family)